MENDKLTHIGVPRRSGRYPWGSGKRPYQSTGGVLKNFKKNRARKAAVKKAQETRKANAEKALQKKNEEAEKNRVLKEGSASDILKYKGKLTNEQMSEAIRRLELEQRLSDLNKTSDVSKGKQAAKKYAGEAAKKIAADTAVDVTAQLVKYYMVQGVNKKILKDDQGVFTNNKRK